MDKEKDVKVTIDGDVKELIIREGDALEALPTPNINIKGGMGTVYEFLRKYPGLIKGNESYIEVDRVTGKIDLNINPCGDQMSINGDVCTVITESEDAKLLQLNTKYWGAKELGDMLRMNQHVLADTNTNIKKIIGDLRNLEVSFNREIKSLNDDRGNTTSLRSQAIQKCNIPKTIDFKIALFENDEEITMTADVEIDPDSLKVILIVVDLRPKIRERLNQLMGAEIKNIQEFPAGSFLPIIYIG